MSRHLDEHGALERNEWQREAAASEVYCVFEKSGVLMRAAIGGDELARIAIGRNAAAETDAAIKRAVDNAKPL